LPVNAAIPAEAPKEDQDEANKDQEQQGRHVRHQAPSQGNIMQPMTGSLRVSRRWVKRLTDPTGNWRRVSYPGRIRKHAPLKDKVAGDQRVISGW